MLRYFAHERCTASQAQQRTWKMPLRTNRLVVALQHLLLFVFPTYDGRVLQVDKKNVNFGTRTRIFRSAPAAAVLVPTNNLPASSRCPTSVVKTTHCTNVLEFVRIDTQANKNRSQRNQRAANNNLLLTPSSQPTPTMKTHVNMMANSTILSFFMPALSPMISQIAAYIQQCD